MGPSRPDFRNLTEGERLARESLPLDAWDFIAGGAEDEVTLRRNRAQFQQHALLPRVLRGAVSPDTSTTVLGASLRAPILVAPVAAQGLAHPEAECATARGAAAAGSLFIAPTIATKSLEEVALAASGPKWLQTYPFVPFSMTSELVRRARAAGYAAICLTLDVPALGNRERDWHNRTSLEAVGMANLAPAGAPAGAEPTEGSYSCFDDALDADFTWARLAELCRSAGLPVVAKGILHPEDARHAIEAGAAAIVVSNHGGRQLDHCVGTLDALPAVAAEVAGEVPVLVDGGIRRGTDVFKMLALGADAVLVGRASVFGLAAGGAAGVTRALEILAKELSNTMALCGCGTVADIAPDLLRPASRSEQEGEYPDWYHEDNLFPTRQRMDWAHRPIVELALATVPDEGGAVLDLGCGNGALLKKIHDGNPNVVPFGVDREPERIAHAHELLPTFAENLVHGDMFEVPFGGNGTLRFALAILTPRRLQQAGPENAARLLVWLRSHCDQLLVYGYGKSLTEFGDLAGFAAAVGIRIADRAPGVRASLAAAY